MKKILLIVLVWVSLNGMDYKLKPVMINDDIWQFVGINEPVTKNNGGNIANTYWVKTNNHWVVFESGCTYEYAKQAHSLMKQIFDVPVKMVINSHLHDDHWMGNSYYKELNIPIYATKAQVTEYKVGGKSRILNILNKKDLVGTKIVSIDNIMENDFSINVDNTIFKFIKIPTPAHVSEDYMLYLPKEKVLFTGDLLMSERLTSIRHGSIEGNLKAIEQIEKINPKVYANGHGVYTDKKGLNLTKEYLTDLKNSALLAIEDDIDLDDYVKNTKLEKYKNYALYKVAHKENLMSAFNEYEFFGEE